MAHGAPDNYEVQQKATTFRLDDMAELAVRLGSPNLFHRLGDTIFMDSFENGLGSWFRDTYLGLSTVEISGDIYKTGGFSCKLISPDSEAGHCGISRGSLFYFGSKIGLEFSFAGDSYGKKIEVIINVHDGASLYKGAILLDIINKTLSYFNTEEDYIVFATGIKTVQNLSIWNTWKLIIDIDTDQYVRLLFNQTVYNLQEKFFYKVAYETTPFITAGCYMQQAQAHDTTLYIDDCILTQNEP